MAAFLREMAGLAGQAEQAAATLELQFGDVQTVTMLDPQGNVPELSISAQLPRDERIAYSQMSISDGMASPDGASDTACLWHADEGRYVMVRRIPVRDLPDERSVFDAILDTADQAGQWYAFLCARLARPH